MLVLEQHEASLQVRDEIVHMAILKCAGVSSSGITMGVPCSGLGRVASSVACVGA
jgi:hypothetical protein